VAIIKWIPFLEKREKKSSEVFLFNGNMITIFLNAQVVP